ncbi:MAG: molecular chaperone GrpE [Candidatus Magnetoglobus multicellularis str. Araruama]|uniref:Molecular chaperone GrpE n=1 Tax=Candidatus Magnetoglobus multicellularis str. Araruama TaxID=890399 RepID=A0A1V1PAS4_9BACT|nr:MAG: molecular chaperone GrpE [Candidatus Magnetoglobus multicellularis str. Araruama]
MNKKDSPGTFSSIRDRITKRLTLPVLKKMVDFLTRRIEKRIQGYVSSGWKAKTLADFQEWLIDLPDELSPTESATLDSCDLYTILTEFSALRQEIKLQNRQQHKAIQALTDTLDEYEKTSTLFKDRTKDIALLEERIRTSSIQASEKRTVGPFLDMRDALMRGYESCKRLNENTSLLRPAPKGIESIVEGYEMAIRRFDRALASVDITPLQCMGKPFDPKYMRAVGTKTIDGTDEGIVVEEMLTGFVRKTEVIRLAEVVVNKQ